VLALASGGYSWIWPDCSLAEVFCGPQICQKCVSGQGSTSRHSRRSRRLLSRLGRGHLLPKLHPVLASLAPNVKSWPRRCAQSWSCHCCRRRNVEFCVTVDEMLALAVCAA